ncbi:MAG: peroxiredoxin family protein [Pyrinomonadaceae bacterium]
MRNAEITVFWIKLARSVKKFSFGVTTIFFFAVWAFAQTPKTILLDADGNRLTDNEFVDLRLANRVKDLATRTILDDGTIQLKLGRVPQEGTPAPPFDAATINGKFLKAGDLKGKVVVFNFWFIGCPGCMEELPKLNSLAAKYHDNGNVQFIAVAPNTAQELRQFLAQQKFDYQMIGSGTSVIDLFNFIGFPRNIVIGKDGKIVYWRTTVRAWDKFDSVIQAELDKN